jgi:hypothetical protein
MSRFLGVVSGLLKVNNIQKGGKEIDEILEG